MAARTIRAGITPPIVRRFEEWRQLRDMSEQTTERIENLRASLMEMVGERGKPDEKGNTFLMFPAPIDFKTWKGAVKRYVGLKSERHMTPANPTPDPELAEELLRKKKLWLKPAQQKVIQDLATACPYARITVEVDPDAVAHAYFQGLLSEAEYEGCLREQRESFQFRPVEEG